MKVDNERYIFLKKKVALKQAYKFILRTFKNFLVFYSESYCNMYIPNPIRGRKVNHSFLSLLPSLGQ
jgi:hypothetical protein